MRLLGDVKTTTPTKLHRSLGLFDAFSIGVNAIIGAGIFVVIGIAAGVAGPALIISVVIGFFISAITAMSFIQLSKKAPIIAFRGLPDGRIPSGVAKEVNQAFLDGKPIIELPSGINKRGMSYEDTLEYLQEVGQR